MAEKEDLLIQEVNEELKAERLRQWWERFGSAVAVSCVALILGTSGYVYWKDQRHEADEAVTSALISSNDTLDRKQYTSAAKQLLALPDRAGAVTFLARLKAADALEKAGKTDKSVEQYQRVAAVKGQAALADYAKLRLGEAADKGETPFRALAVEQYAIRLYEEGKQDEARKLLQELVEAPGILPSARNRAEELLAAFQ